MGELITKLGIDWKLLVANAITFLIVLWLLRKFAYRPILAMLDKRRQTIADGLDNAKKIADERHQFAMEKEQLLHQAKNSAQQLIHQAERQATEQRQVLLTQAQADMQTMVAKTKQQLEREKQQMVVAAKAELAGVVVAATKKVIGEHLDQPLESKLNDQAVKALKEDRA
jgi:F-type H+-transporting ATPase subunit b